MQSGRNRYYLLLALKVLIFGGLSTLLYKQVIRHRHFSEVSEIFQQGLDGDKQIIIALLFFTMLLNWTVEVTKWRTLIHKLKPIRWLTAVEGVMFGIAFSLFTPNRVGEFGGRVMALEEQRGPAIVSTLLGSLSQIVMNLSLGGLGLVLYFLVLEDKAYLEYVFIFLWLLLVLGLNLVYFNLDVVEGGLLKIPILRKVKDKIDIVLRYSRRELLFFLLLSGSRCLIYYFQYWLCLQFFGIEVGLGIGLLLIASIYFIQTAVPTFAIIELVFRGNVAIFFLSGYTNNTAGVFSATFLIWFVNLIIPAFFGLLLFLRHRFLKD